MTPRDVSRHAPDGQHCPRCNGVHGKTENGYRTFVTSLTWPTDHDDEEHD